MKKIYYLSSCDTCKRILKELPSLDGIELIDIKTDPLQAEDLEQLRTKVGSYEDLFNNRSRLYRERGLNKKDLREEDYKNLILEHYTFLKRPVILLEGQIFVGNSKSVVQAAISSLEKG